MTPEQQWTDQGLTAEQKIVLLVAAYEARRIAAPDLAERAAAAMYAANVAATRTADLAVAAWYATRLQVTTLALGLVPPDDEQDRLAHTFATIAATDEAMSRTARASRVATSEPWNRGRRAYQESLRARGVENWRRIVKPDACEACASLAREVVPMDQDFFDHPQCRCTLAPEVTETWADRVRSEQMQLRKTVDTARGPVRLSTGLVFA